MNKWEPTRQGGFRRTRVAQMEERCSDEAEVGVSKASPRAKLFRFAWREKLGLPECPYIVRWRLETPIGSVRIHHWRGPDDMRAHHDHPWWFITMCFRGGYLDLSPDAIDKVRAGSVRFRHALHRHTVVPGPGGAWTLLITGRPQRNWGFWKDGKFRKANKWFASFGHHPCS